MSENKAPDPVERPPDRRKLVAVLYADMVGYSRLIGLDDVGTLERLRSLRKDLIDPAIEEYGGRIVQTGGDSLLIVFDSIDGAVRCAMKVQQRVPVHDGDQPADRAIRFRIQIQRRDYSILNFANSVCILISNEDFPTPIYNQAVWLMEAFHRAGRCAFIRKHVESTFIRIKTDDSIPKSVRN